MSNDNFENVTFRIDDSRDADYEQLEAIKARLSEARQKIYRSRLAKSDIIIVTDKP